VEQVWPDIRRAAADPKLNIKFKRHPAAPAKLAVAMRLNMNLNMEQAYEQPRQGRWRYLEIVAMPKK
jgi:hypothetical protein